MLRRLIGILSMFLLAVLWGSPLPAQSPGVPPAETPPSYTFSQFGRETLAFVKQPTRWDAGDWLKLGVIGAGTFAIMETADQPIRDAMLKDQRYAKSYPIEAGRIWGELYSPIALFSGFAIHSLITGDMKTRKIGYEIGQASLYAGAVTYLLKAAIGRARPYTGEGNTSFHPFASLLKQDSHSLPSGHNAVAFVLSTVLSRNVNALWLKILAYVPAALTFISRVYQDRHWTSDDFLGAAVGYSIATWVVDQHEQASSSSDPVSMSPLSITITF
jgi:membrane-associated phospholipid phosphatase